MPRLAASAANRAFRSGEVRAAMTQEALPTSMTSNVLNIDRREAILPSSPHPLQTFGTPKGDEPFMPRTLRRAEGFRVRARPPSRGLGKA
jgi:hypothetical protein